jgi:L-rhamnose mutarotase
MIRKAFVMSVNPDQHAEYEKRHRPIWPELEETLKAHGVLSYSIFLDEAQWAAIAQTEICGKWWAHMGDIMPSNPDNSPVANDLREVFHIEK